MGETLYRRPEIPFRWRRLCFGIESPGGDFISVKGRLCFGETLFRDIPARLPNYATADDYVFECSNGARICSLRRCI